MSLRSDQSNSVHIRQQFPQTTYQTTVPITSKLPPDPDKDWHIHTQSSHLWPIFSLCFSRARSTCSGDVNWTNPSPAARPWPSFTMTIPLGTIGSPVTTNPQPNTSQMSHHNVAASNQPLTTHMLCYFYISITLTNASNSSMKSAQLRTGYT